MNLYDVLNILIDKADGLQEATRADARKVIQEAEKLGLFGNIGEQQVRAHEHNYNAAQSEIIRNGGGFAIEIQTFKACCHCGEELSGSRQTKPVGYTHHGLYLR